MLFQNMPERRRIATESVRSAKGPSRAPSLQSAFVSTDRASTAALCEGRQAKTVRTGVIVLAEDNLVSIVIPVYNGERFISRTLASAQAQTYAPIEIVVASVVRISDGAQVEGTIAPQELTIGGRFKGTIQADRVTLTNSAVVEGVRYITAPWQLRRTLGSFVGTS
jgi:hypothetical protein